MYAMFIKEMRQFFRHYISKVAILIALVCWTMVFFAIRMIKKWIAESENVSALEMGDNVGFFVVLLAIAACCGVCAIVAISCSRWRMELADPAFSPGITTCTPAWQLALGKWSAVMIQALVFVAVAGILPIKVLAFDLPDKLVNGRVMSSKDFLEFMTDLPLVSLCLVTALVSMTLAISSLKPRSRGRYDFGMLAVFPVLFALIGVYGDIPTKFLEIGFVTRTVVVTVGSLALISSGVSAPGSNRLLFFKVWMTASVLILMPLVYHFTECFSRVRWVDELVAVSLFFIVCSLFERLIQSRRVMAQTEDPLLKIALFPFTTGALNSLVLSVLLALAAFFVDRCNFLGRCDFLLLVFALGAMCNFAGLLIERCGKRFIRFAAFCVLGWLSGAFVFYIEEEYPGFPVDQARNIRIVLSLISLVFSTLLAINYNYRKKDL